jgi:short-subunit dehydrogenase
MKQWIVTGSSSGIGLEITKILLKMGKKVIGISRTAPKELKSDNYQHLSFDLNHLESISSLKFDLDQLEGVIFSHGYGLFKNLEEFSDSQIFELVNVNLLSTVLLTKLFIPSLKKLEKSFLIYLGSEAGIQGKTRSSIYSLTKFGLRGFVQSVRKECATSSVKVSMIQPGMTRTPFYDNLYFEPKPEEKHAIDPEDIAKILPLIIESSIGSCFEEINLSPQANAVKFKN